MIDDDMNSAYHQVLHRAFRIAAETGELCRPVHLLAALAERDGRISDTLRPPGGDPLFRRPVDPPPDRGGGASYLAMQTQQAARQLASERGGTTTTPEHLFLAILDQADPEAVALLTHAGLDMSILRTAALDILGAPRDLPPMAMPLLAPAGTMDRPPLPISQLDPTAWAALCWRQDHLPLRRLRRRGHYGELSHLEYKAASRVASKLRLDDDQHCSLSWHHLDRVEQLATQSNPDLVERRPVGSRFATARMVPIRHRHSWRWRRRLGFMMGWGTWFSNRQVGLRDRWFRVRTIADYRGAPDRKGAMVDVLGGPGCLALRCPRNDRY